MKFIHTGDWQIGMKAAHVGAAGSRVREERFAAARRVVTAASKAHADFILVAGDTFEGNGMDRIAIQRIADTLAEFAGPVYVIPGNHDPFVPGSVWEHPAWNSHGNLRVLMAAEPLQVPGGLVFPCPALSKHSGKDPTAWIPDERSGEIRIGLAHGTVEGVSTEEPEFPIRRTAAKEHGLDYLALGHWHSTSTYPDDSGAVRMAYSGTHETTKFGERDSGNALLVQIDAPGTAPEIEVLRTGGLRWEQIEEDVRVPGDLQRLRAGIEALPNPDHLLLDLRIRGILAAQDRDEINRIKEITSSRFLFSRISTADLRPAPADDAWLAELPPGVLREAARTIRDLANPAFEGLRPEGATPQVAARALVELFALKGGSD